MITQKKQTIFTLKNGKKITVVANPIYQNCYSILIINDEKSTDFFKMELKPSFPRYQLLNQAQKITKENEEILPEISKWIIEFEANEESSLLEKRKIEFYNKDFLKGL